MFSRSNLVSVAIWFAVSLIGAILTESIESALPVFVAVLLDPVAVLIVSIATIASRNKTWLFAATLVTALLLEYYISEIAGIGQFDWSVALIRWSAYLIVSGVFGLIIWHLFGKKRVASL